MAKHTSIFLTGATGYIGGTVLQRLLDHSDRATLAITLLIRDPAKARKFARLGVKTIAASLDDHDALQQAASDADVVINTASSDHLAAVNAILAGLKQRKQRTGEPSVLIHTSGTAEFVNEEEDPSIDPDTIFYDSRPEQIESLPLTRIHRQVDTAIVAADEEGYVRTFIILPSAVFGLASGPLVDLGLQQKHSIPIPHLIRVSLLRGRTGAIAGARNIWPLVEIGEMGDLYRLVFDAALADPNTLHGREGYYIAESGEFSTIEMTREVARVLYDLGKVKSPEPDVFSSEEHQTFFLGSRLGALNCRVRGERSRSLGWKPTKLAKDQLASILPEVLAILDAQ